MRPDAYAIDVHALVHMPLCMCHRCTRLGAHALMHVPSRIYPRSTNCYRMHTDSHRHMHLNAYALAISGINACPSDNSKYVMSLTNN